MKTKQNTSSEKRTIIAPSGIILFIVILFWILGGQKSFAQGVGISEASITADPSAILELKWTSGPFKGFLAPRLTSAQRNAIASPANGLLVYDTDTKSYWYWDVVWIAISGGSSILGVANGGTGLSSITANNLLYGNGTSALSLLSPGGTTGAILMNTDGGAPSWSLLSGLPSTAGILPVANGGTGATSLTNHGVLIGQSTSPVIVTSSGTASQVLTSNGVGTDPSFQAPITIPTSIQVFSSNGTLTKPANVSKVWVKVWGGGGAGRTSNNTNSGGGGGGGAYSEGLVVVTVNVAVTVGAGGSPSGASGGTSSFVGATPISANGGSGASGGTPSIGGAGGTVSGLGTIQVAGGPGGNG